MLEGTEDEQYEQRDVDLVDTLDAVFGQENVFVLETPEDFQRMQDAIEARSEPPKIDETQLRIHIAQLDSELSWFRSLRIEDDGEYKSTMNALENLVLDMDEIIIKYFGLPEDWN